MSFVNWLGEWAFKMLKGLLLRGRPIENIPGSQAMRMAVMFGFVTVRGFSSSKMAGWTWIWFWEIFPSRKLGLFYRIKMWYDESVHRRQVGWRCLVFLYAAFGKAVKRRVDSGICHREPGRVRAGAEGTVENGLGAAHRSVRCTPRLRRVHPLS